MTFFVTIENDWLEVGTKLRLTGRASEADQMECVRVGYFDPAPERNAEDGQIIWIKRDTLNRIAPYVSSQSIPSRKGREPVPSRNRNPLRGPESE